MKGKTKLLSLGSARGRLKVFLYGFGLFLGLFFIILACYSKAYEQRVLVNSYLFSSNISGSSRDDIRSLLIDKENANRSKVVKLHFEGKEFENSLENLGWDLDEDATTNKIFDYGHSENGFANILSFLKSIFLKKYFKIQYSVNERLVDDWIVSINEAVAKPKIEANVIVRYSEAKIVEPEEGTKIDESKLKSELDQSFSLDLDGDLNLELIKDVPLISREQADALAQEAIDKSSEGITVIGPGGEAVLYPNDLGAMTRLKVKMKGGSFFQDPEVESIFVSLDNSKLQLFLEDNATDLNIEPVDARFTVSGGRVALYQPSVVGETIKIAESVDEIILVFEKNEQKTVELPRESQEPTIFARDASDIEKYGIRELIGTATTSFTGSPDNRVHNIKTGVKYISGALVKAGDEFSTISKLGQIDAGGGYLQELVIKENETIPEFGGGLCQVSTTLFRAAMNAGLKITERQNHSYRVSYYEPPVGMDATIYSPKPDFRFVNSTDNAILVYGYVTGYSVTFEIYGTSDGRTVEISNPEIYDITSPPETIYIDDPSLEPGEEKRLDRAHDGAKARFYYKVRKGGEVIEDETFLSYYVAWPAKYLRGPQVESDQAPEGEGGGGDSGQSQN